MPVPLVITNHPSVHLRLQRLYKEAASVIWPLHKLAYRLHGSSNPPFTPYEATKISDPLRYPFLQELKGAQISWQAFEQGVKKFRGPKSRKAFYQGCVDLYRQYEEKKSGEDVLDALQGATENIKRDPTRLKDFSEILVLTGPLRPLEQALIEAMSKVSPRVKRVQWNGSSSQKSEVKILKGDSIETEVEWVIDELGKLHQQGVAWKECFIYVTDLKLYRTSLEIFMSKANIPLSFWDQPGTDTFRDLDVVSCFSWDPRGFVFGEMKGLFMMGAHRLPRSFDVQRVILSEDEKNYFNQALRQDVFSSLSDERERFLETFLSMVFQADHARVSGVAPLLPWLDSTLEGMDSLQKISSKPPSPTCLSSFLKEIRAREDQKLLPTTFSVRSLTQFKNCPYGFLIKECLKLSPKPLETVDLSSLQEGEVYHTLLWKYFSEKMTDLTPLAEKVFLEAEQKFGRLILPSERRRMEATLLYFLKTEESWQRGSSYTPHFFEKSFEGLKISLGGKTVLLRGKIDRIDVHPRDKTFRIIDYKTGKVLPTQKEVESGKHLQLPLYAIAVEEFFLPGYFPRDAYFYGIKTSERRRGFQCETREVWNDFKLRVAREVLASVTEIEKMLFKATPEACYPSCDLRHLCES